MRVVRWRRNNHLIYRTQQAWSKAESNRTKRIYSLGQKSESNWTNIYIYIYTQENLFSMEVRTSNILYITEQMKDASHPGIPCRIETATPQWGCACPLGLCPWKKIKPIERMKGDRCSFHLFPCTFRWKFVCNLPQTHYFCWPNHQRLISSVYYYVELQIWKVKMATSVSVHQAHLLVIWIIIRLAQWSPENELLPAYPQHIQVCLW